MVSNTIAATRPALAATRDEAPANK
jgi:hypothetical protein